MKPHKSEEKHIKAYTGEHKFSQLEDWAMDVCYHLAACCYGGDDMDQEHIFVVHKFIDEEVWNWFHHHVLHINQDKQDWTFEEVLIGLYNCFVSAATMQEACEAFQTAVYDAKMGIQTFYDDLMEYQQMWCALIRNDNLSPEVNTVTEVLAYAICNHQLAKKSIPVRQRPEYRSGADWLNVPDSQPVSGPPQIGAKHAQAPLAKVKASKPMMKVGVGAKLSGEGLWCYNCGRSGHFAKDCYVPPKVQVRAVHTAMALSEHDLVSNVREDPEELIKDKEGESAEEEHSVVNDAESIMIDGDEYIAVDIYNYDYYAWKDKEEHLFALTDRPDDKHVYMRCVTLQKAADKLQQLKYTPQEKERLVTYVYVNGHPAWTLWDSGSTTTGITPQFAHINAIHVYKLEEPLMLQLGMVDSCTMVQFGAEVKVRTSETLTEEYVDIANFDCYDMIIGTQFMCKNKVTLDFVNNIAIVNRVPVRAEKVVLKDTDDHLQWYCVMEKHCDSENCK
ncbi:hypothetical protein C0993_009407 [Termitomyces sp. T159_Od127]|nr:hypothetical protein C0993_009407 [Termitomyces sp. T159_Od127]